MDFHTTHAIAEAASQLQNPDNIESQPPAPKSDDINYDNDLSSHAQEQFNLLPESVITQSPPTHSSNDSNIMDNSKIGNATMGDDNDMTQAVTETIVTTDNIPISTDNMLEEVLKKAIEEDNPHEDKQIIDEDMHMSDLHIDDPSKTSDTHHELDNEAFSKLLEIDSKDDKELFSTNDVVEDHISKSVTENDNSGDIESIHMLTSVKDSEDKTRESTVKLEDDKKPEESTNSTAIISTLESKKISLPFSNTPEIALSPRNNEKSIVVVKPEDGTNGESNLVQKLFMEKSLMEQQQRKNSIIPGMFHTNDLHPKINQLESLGEHGNSLIRSNNGLSPLEAADPNLLSGLNPGTTGVPDEQPTIFAYARLDFQNFTFYVQTLHAIIGRRSENDTTHKVDVNLGPSKSISRRHAQIFYNFGTGRFELSIIGKNGAFVDDNFVERGKTVPLTNKTKIQIGQIPFQFVLPDQEKNGLEEDDKKAKGAKGAKATKATAKKAKKAPAKKTTVKKETAKKTPAVKKDTATKKETTKKKDTAAKKEAGPKKKIPKTTVKKEKKPAKAPKKVYTLEEIPEQYRTKPVLSYSAMLTTCIRKNTTEKGMSLSEIYAGIRELFPFYKYCPDGWQSSVRHNLSLNKSFRKVSKEGKGWLWGLDESYIAEREQQKQKQAEAAKAKQEAAQARQEQQQQQKAKKANSKASATKKQSISQTLAANRSANNNASRASDHQRTMKYLQGQLMILTKDRKGLTKQVIANILTQALAMTINQVTQAAKNKGISGNPLTALMDKNPKHLNLILAAAVNAATAKVTNGKIKSLVSMNPSTVEKPKITTQQPNIQRSKGTNTSTISQETKQVKNESTSKAKDNSDLEPESESLDNSFDPTSLSRFFQPRQQSRATPASAGKPTASITPQKRPLEESSDESSDESTSESESESDSDEEDEDEDDDEDDDDDDDEEEDDDDDEEDGEDGDDDDGDDDEDDDEEEEDDDNDEEADATDDNDDKSVASNKPQEIETAVIKSPETASNISSETNQEDETNQTNNKETSGEASTSEEKHDTKEANSTTDADGDLVMKDTDNTN